MLPPLLSTAAHLRRPLPRSARSALTLTTTTLCLFPSSSPHTHHCGDIRLFGLYQGPKSSSLRKLARAQVAHSHLLRSLSQSLSHPLFKCVLLESSSTLDLVGASSIRLSGFQTPSGSSCALIHVDSPRQLLSRLFTRSALPECSPTLDLAGSLVLSVWVFVPLHDRSPCLLYPSSATAVQTSARCADPDALIVPAGPQHQRRQVME